MEFSEGKLKNKKRKAFFIIGERGIRLPTLGIVPRVSRPSARCSAHLVPELFLKASALAA